MDPLETFKENLASGTRLLGLDIGSKTIGLALSDTRQIIATGLETRKRGKFKDDCAYFKELQNIHLIGGFVLGLPFNMDGSEGPRAQASRAYGRNLQTQFELPILYWDERLTSLAADRLLIEADTSREKRKKIIDKLAATLILQGALDRLEHLNK